MTDKQKVESDQAWWLEAAASSLERKRAKSKAESALAQPGDSFLIVTEGKVTEPVYMSLLRSYLQLPAVQIKIAPGDASDPRHVIRSAAREKKEHSQRAKKGHLGAAEPSRYDHVWAVIDTDVAVRNGIWNDVSQLAARSKVKLAHSTPCFEYWILLHLHYTTAPLVDGDAAKTAVRRALQNDYCTNREVTERTFSGLIPNWQAAQACAERVRKFHLDAGTPLPADPSTDVDLLVRSLYEALPPHLTDPFAQS